MRIYQFLKLFFQIWKDLVSSFSPFVLIFFSSFSTIADITNIKENPSCNVMGLILV